MGFACAQPEWGVGSVEPRPRACCRQSRPPFALSEVEVHAPNGPRAYFVVSFRMNPINPVWRERFNRSAWRIIFTPWKHCSTSSLTRT